MKRYVILAAILALVSVSVLLTSAQVDPGPIRTPRLDLTLAAVRKCNIRNYTANPESNVVGKPCDVIISDDGFIYQKGAGTGTDTTGWTVNGIGDVTAAAAFATDNCVIRSDGTGKGAQVSQWCVDDGGTGTGVEVDAEGTGNIVTIPFEELFPWANCQAGVGTLLIGHKTNPPTAGCIVGTNIDWPMATFPDTDVDANGEFKFPVPAGFTGTVDIAGKWRTAATTNAIVIQFKWACTADNEVANDTWSSASTTTETANGTTLRWNAWSITGVTLTGCAADEDYIGMVFRNRTHGSDTLAATFDMVGGVRFTFRRAM